MKIEISDGLYDVFVKMVTFMDSDGIPESVRPLNKKTIAGWIEHGAEMYVLEYLNSCRETWKTNKMFQELENAFETYNRPFIG